MHQPASNFPPVVQASCPRTTSPLRCTSTWRDGSLSHLQRQVNHAKIVSTTQWVYNFYSVSHRCTKRGWGPHFSESGTDFFFFGAKLRQKLWAGVGGGPWGGVVEIKSLQVPGERTQSAKRAKERRRDKRFLFKLIPLRPSRFPSQDSQKSDKNLALWIWQRTGREEGEEEERWFRGRETERTEGNCGGEEPVEADQGETGETRRVGSFSEGASRQHCVPVKRQSREGWRYQLSNPCYTSDDVLNQSNMGVSLSCPGPGSWNIGSFRAGLRSDSGWGWCRYPQPCWGLKGTSDIRATQRPHSLPDTLQTCPVHSRSTQPHNEGVCVSSPIPWMYFTAQYEAIIEGFHSHQKRKIQQLFHSCAVKCHDWSQMKK